MNIPPIVGSLFSWKSSFTNRRTSEDYVHTCKSTILSYASIRDELIHPP